MSDTPMSQEEKNENDQWSCSVPSGPSGATTGSMSKSQVPTRVQRKRTKGWLMPENTVYVGRRTVYGNSTTIDDYWDSGFSGSEHAARVWAVNKYRELLMEDGFWANNFRAQIRRELRGKNLACWCPLHEPCHADVLLAVANGDTRVAVSVGMEF